MRYGDEQFSPNNNPGPRAGVGPFVDPQQLAQLLMAARAAQQVGQAASAAQLSASAPVPALPASVLGPTDPFAAGAGAASGVGTAGPQPSAPAPDPDPGKAAAIQKLRQPQANQGQGAGASSTSSLATEQAPGQLTIGKPKPTPLESIQGIVGDVATSKTDSTDYLVAKSKGRFKAGSDKCNLLVADTIEESGLPRPQVHYTNEGVMGAIKSKVSREPDANEWANPNVKIPGWSEPRPLSEARPGDVISQQHGNGGHAGMVVLWGGGLLTVSVNTADKIPGLVTRNPWGFRPRGQNGESPNDPEPVVRHYIGK